MVKRATLCLLALVCLAFLAGSGQAQAFDPLFMHPERLPAKKFAPVLGLKMGYYDVGKGPTIVLVHGFASEAIFDWGSVIPELAKTHRVLAIDGIGWGASDKPQIDYSIQTFVDFLGEFLRTNHVDHFALAGESLGGWIVSSYTLQALSPNNIGPYALPKPDKLILEDAAGHRTVRTAAPPKITGTLADAAGVKVIFFHKDWITPEFIRAAYSLKLRANDGATQRSLRTSTVTEGEVVGEKLAQITIPTLVIWGANDMVVPIADGQDFAAKIPGAKLVVVPECGHVPSMEQPRAFLDAVASFLR